MLNGSRGPTRLSLLLRPTISDSTALKGSLPSFTHSVAFAHVSKPLNHPISSLLNSTSGTAVPAGDSHPDLGAEGPALRAHMTSEDFKRDPLGSLSLLSLDLANWLWQALIL